MLTRNLTASDNLRPMRHDAVHGRCRWWTLAELSATSEVLAPRALAQLMADLLHDGPPKVALSIGL